MNPEDTNELIKNLTQACDNFKKNYLEQRDALIENLKAVYEQHKNKTPVISHLEKLQDRLKYTLDSLNKFRNNTIKHIGEKDDITKSLTQGKNLGHIFEETVTTAKIGYDLQLMEIFEIFDKERLYYHEDSLTQEARTELEESFRDNLGLESNATLTLDHYYNALQKKGNVTRPYFSQMEAEKKFKETQATTAQKELLGKSVDTRAQEIKSSLKEEKYLTKEDNAVGIFTIGNHQYICKNNRSYATNALAGVAPTFYYVFPEKEHINFFNKKKEQLKSKNKPYQQQQENFQDGNYLIYLTDKGNNNNRKNKQNYLAIYVPEKLQTNFDLSQLTKSSTQVLTTRNKHSDNKQPHDEKIEKTSYNISQKKHHNFFKELPNNKPATEPLAKENLNSHHTEPSKEKEIKEKKTPSIKVR